MNQSMAMEFTEEELKAAEELVADLSLKEKVSLMSGKVSVPRLAYHVTTAHYNHIPYLAGGIKRKNLPPMAFVDGPRGCVASNNATCFPVSIARGATFDPALEERVGEVIAKEIRSLGGNYFGGVCVNLVRHPAMGRAQESYGEDTFHVGEMGKASTRGVQRHNVMACVKHFALNNQENTRFTVNCTADERALHEVYLEHFRQIVTEGGAASVMGAYNKFEGEHCCESNRLLRQILKEEWGFQGFVISDFFMGVRNTVKAALGGCDIEMMNTRFYGPRLVAAVKKGRVPESVVDESAQRIVRTIVKFKRRQDPQEYDKSLLSCQVHRDLALEVAEKSFVLLKNDNANLPWDMTKITEVAVIGTLAKKGNIGDYGSSRVFPPYVTNALDSLKELLEPSGVKVVYNSGKKIEAAAKLAASSDVVLVVCGYSQDDEGEFVLPVGQSVAKVVQKFHAIGGDRASLTLKKHDEALIKACSIANSKSCATLIGSAAILCEEWRNQVTSIIMAFYPGQEGGKAIARTLFGLNNPGGKLPYNVPTSSEHLPEFDRWGNKCEYSLFHGYTLAERNGWKAAFPFGHGLSYSSFAYSGLSLVVASATLKAEVTVTNTSKIAGDEVVQLYVGFSKSAIERPVKLLRGFQRVHVEPGEAKSVTITCALERLKWYNPATKAWELEIMEYEAYVGGTSDPTSDKTLFGIFNVEVSKL